MVAGSAALRMSGLLGWLQVDPGNLSPIVDLFGANGLENAGNYEYITNTGSLGGQADPTNLSPPWMPSADANSFSAYSAFAANRSPGFIVVGPGQGKGFNMSLNNGFKSLHLTSGATLFIRCKMKSVLNNATGYGMYFSDMTGIPGNIGLHVKYFSSNGQLVIDVGNGVSIFNATSAVGAIEINSN